jgi:methionyl-tRNA formyltransferase
MILQRAVPITAATTAQLLHDRLAQLGAELIVPALEGLDDGALTARPQASEGVTYAAKLDKAEGRLDWRESAAVLDRRVRAFTPWPGAYFEVAGEKGQERVKVLAAAPTTESGTPGAVLDGRATVACGVGALRLLKMQRAGKAPLEAEAFLRGFPLPIGTRLS